MAAQKETSLRGTKQSHDANDNNKQIANKSVITSQPSLRGGTTKQSASLIPKLRFKEFKGEWEQKKLVSKIDFIAGYAFKSFEMKSVDSKYQLLKMSNIYKSELQLNRNPSYWEEIDSKLEKYLLKKKDILLTLTGTVGKQDYGYSIVIPENNRFLLNQRLVCLRAKPKESDADFINNLIKTSKFYYFFFNESKGGTGNQTNVGIDDLRNIKLSFPNLPEQQKIANFLTAVDTKLQQLTTKKETLAQYKKGVMQQLFSQQLRFKPDVIARTQDDAISPNETQFPDWEEKRLGEVGKIVSGLTYSPNDLVDEENGVLVLRSSNVHDGKLSFEDNKYVKVDSFNPVEKDDILICVRNGSKRLIGKNAIIDNETAGVAFGAFMSIYRSKFNNYLFHYFGSNEYNKEVHKNLGATINSINGSDLKKFKVPFPSLKEQQKIANYLSAIDLKIEAVQTQLTNTQAFKKGVLQAMFV